MTITHEKLLFGFTSYICTAFCGMGAIVNSGETRWIYVTLAVGVMTSAFLALSFKQPEDTIRMVVGRCGLSVMGSMVGSKVVVYFYHIAGVDDDVMLLSGLCMIVCIASYFLGHGLLRALNRNSDNEGSGLLSVMMTVLKALISGKP